MGGSKDWLSLMPGLPTDISIDVDAAVKDEARKSGCQIISMANVNEVDFLKKIKSLPKKVGMTYHLAFTDHGAPASKNINESILITGLGEHTTYPKFLNALKETIPKGSHISFQTNNCWPHFSEALIVNNMENHFDICGGSSTIPEQMSWNKHDLDVYTNGNYDGPYGAVGLHYANEFKKINGYNPSLSDFHAHAKKGDRGNRGRQPGLTTSVNYANLILLSKKIKSPLIATDINDLLLSINWKNGEALDKFLATPKQKIDALTESFLSGSCRTFQKNPFEDFLKTISPIYYNLLVSDYDSLPNPYRRQVKDAKKWMQVHQKNLATLLSTIVLEKGEFIKKSKNFPKEKYAKVEEEWVRLKDKHSFALKDYEYNLRILQEGMVIQSFMVNSNPEEKLRYQKFLACENKPIY